MSDWFTVRQIDANTWVISEPHHWEETHCYLLQGHDRALLIDSGLGVCDLEPIVRSLTALPVTVIATHIHWDHIGSHGSFESMGVHPLEEAWLQHFPLLISQVRRDLLRDPCPFPVSFDPDAFSPFQGNADFLVENKDRIDLGGRIITALHTPGHSPGHLCFYEAATGYLFTGDLLYHGTLYAFYPSTDPLAFAASVEKLQPLPVTRLFPAHHALPDSPALLPQVHAAFTQLRAENKLFQGSGMHNFESFNIHL